MGATGLHRPKSRHTRPGNRGGDEPARNLAHPSTRPTLRHLRRPSARVEVVHRSGDRNLRLAVAANFGVVILPAAAVWALSPGGGPAWWLGSVSLAVVGSVATASLGSALWRRRLPSSELVFSDLMLWGWMRRARARRRLAAARDVLILDSRCVGPRRLPADRHLAGLKRLSGLIEAQDPYTRGHSLRVTRHAEGIARAMHLPTCEAAKLRTAAALHDIGKLHTPPAILHKPGRLTDEEFGLVKRHPGEGADMLSTLDDPAVAAMVRHHHERLDGSGYPDGLVGDEIPLGARIIAVADTFDAMTSNRSYRGAFPHKKALDVLSNEAGTRLDAAAVSAFHAYYSGRKLAACSALVTTAAARLGAWLGNRQQVMTAAAPSLGKALPAIGAAALLAGPVGGPALRGEAARPTCERHPWPAGSPTVTLHGARLRGSNRSVAPRGGRLRGLNRSAAPRGDRRAERPSLRRAQRTPVERTLERPAGASDRTGTGPTPGALDPLPDTQPRALPAVPALEPPELPTPPAPEPLPLLHVANVESPKLEPPAVEPPAAQGPIAVAPIRLPSAEALDIDVTLPIPALDAVR